MEKTKKSKSKRNWIIFGITSALLLVFLLFLAVVSGVLIYYSDNLKPYKSDYGLGSSEESYDYLPGEPQALPYEEEAEIRTEYEAGAPKTAADSVDEIRDEGDQKVIKTGYLTLLVKKVGDSVSEITGIATSKGGFVLSSSIYTSPDETQSGTITLKVPVDKFEETVENLKEIAVSVERENLSGQDVTEEYTDLQAQLKNYRAEEEQYLEILKRTNTIEETLSVTEKLSLVRGKIERVEGQIKYLESQTDMSTITATLKEETRIDVPTKEWQPWETVKTAFRTFVRFLQGMVDVFIWIVIFLGPAVLIVWLIVWLIMSSMKKRK
jgi:hypothetical protein